MVNFISWSDTDKAKKEIVLADFIDSGIIQWSVMGSIATGTLVDGVRVVPFDCDIVAVYFSIAERGNSGNTIADVNSGSATIPNPGDVDGNIALTTLYTTQANRPTLSGDSANKNDNRILNGLLPDTVSLSEGDILTMDIDSVTSASRDLTLQLFIKKV